MNTTKHIHGKYLPHVDGIRTVAVIPVVLYHLFALLCPGGYIGVDIFFVISGYLITKSILKELGEGHFTIKEFYTRRIRRIIPAYVALILVVLAVGAFIYGEGAMERLVKTARYSTGFASNIYFNAKTGGYWDAAAESNPLLHLWSLGVEEQFYIITPLALLFIYKFKRKWIFPAILFCFSASLCLSIACEELGKRIFNFYMLPTRTWELLAGSILAYYSTKTAAPNKSWLGMIGMGICLSCCFLYSSSTPFPGLAALPPVIGAALMIRYGGAGLCGGILSSRPFVWVGAISYSLYLWHWPLVAYWNYLSYNSSNPIGLASIFVLSFALAWLSWRYIEMPVRLAKRWDFKRAITLLGVSIAVICALCFALKLTKYNFIEHADSARDKEWHWNGAASEKWEDPNFTHCNNQTPHSLTFLGKDENPQYILWGDSHAWSLSPGFHQFSLKTGINGLYINRTSTFDNQNNYVTHLKGYSTNIEDINTILAWIEKAPIKNVILHGRWPCMVEGFNNENKHAHLNLNEYKRKLRVDAGPQEVFTKGFSEICDRLHAMGKNVIIIYGIPEIGENVIELHERNSSVLHHVLGIEAKGLSRESYNERQAATKAILKNIAQARGMSFIDVEPYFFNAKHPNFARTLGDSNNFLYIDDDHISPSGAESLIEELSPAILKALEAQ